MADRVGFISLYGPESLPDTIPEQVRVDMVGVPLPFRYEQKDRKLVAWFDTSELFPVVPNDPVFVNSMMAAAALRAFGHYDSEEYWLEVTARLSAEHNIKDIPRDLWSHRPRTIEELRTQVDIHSRSVFPIFGTGRPMTGRSLDGGLPISRDAGVIRTASDQLDTFIEMKQPVFGFKYVNHFAGDADGNAFLTNYAEGQAKQNEVDVQFWRLLGALSVYDDVVAGMLEPSRARWNFPQVVTYILREAGMTGETFSLR